VLHALFPGIVAYVITRTLRSLRWVFPYVRVLHALFPGITAYMITRTLRLMHKGGCELYVASGDLMGCPGSLRRVVLTGDIPNSVLDGAIGKADRAQDGYKGKRSQ
jgi:hypothetical protein